MAASGHPPAVARLLPASRPSWAPRVHPLRPQRTARRRRRHHRGHAHSRLGAGDRDGARCGRRGHGDLAPGPADRGRIQARGFAGAGRARAWANCWAARCRCARLGRRRGRAPGEVVLLENCRVNKGEKKNSDELRAEDGGAVRRLRQRRLRHRASRRGHDLRHRPVRHGRLRRPAAGRRDRRARQGARRSRSGRWWRSSPAPRSRPS